MPSTRHHGSSTILASIGLLAAAIAAGCGPAETTGGAGGQPSTTASTGTPTEAACAKDPRVVPYTVGVEAKTKDGALSVHFLDASPAPPAKGYNTWTVQVLDGKGAPVNGATIVTKGFMPDHNHGTSTTPKVTAKGQDGTYEITPMVLFMPGVWQITFAVTTSGGVTDSAMVTFCADG
jgi:YtkA-like protein